MYGFPKGSMLERLLFNIDLTDMLLECNDNNVNRYVFDTIPYSCAEHVPFVITELQSIVKKYQVI